MGEKGQDDGDPLIFPGKSEEAVRDPDGDWGSAILEVVMVHPIVYWLPLS